MKYTVRVLNSRTLTERDNSEAHRQTIVKHADKHNHVFKQAGRMVTEAFTSVRARGRRSTLNSV